MSHLRKIKLALLLFSLTFFFWCPTLKAELVKGIYITQSTLENTQLINYLISRSKTVGISTFIVDLDIPSKKYRNNIELLKKHNIAYVARIVIFPGGGTHQQIISEDIWEKRYRLVKHAIEYGAQQIQLDYIRYDTRHGPSPEHAKNVYKIIQWFKDRVDDHNVPLQIDVFGIASFGEEKNIGQNIKLFSDTIDVLCPMVYPSHYEPYKVHAVTPYQTVFNSLNSIKAQFNGRLPFKLYPYLELSNYRYPLSQEKKLAYIYSQIKAAEDAGADGWYAWSARNKYDNLFHVLEKYSIK